MRNSMRRFSGSSALRACSSFCTATAHCTASTTLANSARRLSPGRIHHPAAVLLDELEEGLFVRLKGGDGGRLVVLHEAAVAGDVGAQDGGKLAVEGFRVHQSTSALLEGSTRDFHFSPALRHASTS